MPSEKKDNLISALDKENILAAYIGDITDKPFDAGRRIRVEK